MFKKMCRTDSDYMIKHMKSWFSLFGVRLMVRYDNRPPFSSRSFKAYCDEYGIKLHLCSLYDPKSLGRRQMRIAQALRKHLRP